MAAGQRDRILVQLRLLAGDATAGDAELLDRFLASREEPAFAALVQRHGPLVLGVCRRLLRDEQDAEDAFQATFLVLARKAASIRKKESLGAWLYEVAFRIAVRLRADAARRKLHERQAPEVSAVDATDPMLWQELAAVLDEELNRLPEKYRRPLVLCHLQGRTHAQAARELGVPAGSLSRHLQRARELLRERLAGRGFTLPAALLGTVLTRQAATACVPLSLVDATTRAAFLAAVGEAAGVSARAVALAEGVVKTMSVLKLKLAIVLAAVGAVLAASVGAAVWQSSAANPPEARGEQPPKAAPAAKPRTDRLGDPLPPGAIERLGTLRFRHEGEASSLVFSPDGKLLAAKSGAGVVHLWDAGTGKELRRFPSDGFTLAIGNAIDFSPDGKVLAAPASGRQVALWEAATGKQISQVELPEVIAIHSMRYSPDGKVLAVGADNHCYLLDASTGKPLHHFKELVNALAFTPDGQALVAGLYERGPPKSYVIQFRSVRTGEVLRRFKDDSLDFVRAVAFSPDGKILATGSLDRVRLWDAATGKVVRRIEAKMGQPVNLSFTPNGRTLVAGTEIDGKVHVWDVMTGKEVRQLEARQSAVRSSALSPDGKTVAAGGVYNAIRLWDLNTGLRLFWERDVGHDAPVYSAAYTPDGKWIISGGDNYRIQFWDARTSAADHGLWCPLVHVFALSGDGKRLASFVPWNTQIDLWDAVTGQPSHRLPGAPHVDAITATVLSPDGRTVVSAGWKRPSQKEQRGSGKLLLWDAATGRLLCHFVLGQMRADCLAYSPDGKTLAAGGAAEEGPIRLWNLQEGKEIAALVGHQHAVAAVAFAPDGRTLVSAGGQDQTVRLWEVATGKEIFTLLRRQGRNVGTVAFSPDGRIIAAGDGDDRPPGAAREPNRIRLWDAATGEEIRHFQGHDTNVNALAFSPDGSRLASGLRDSTILIWEVPATPRRPEVRLGPEELAALWKDLVGGDARKAHAAIAKLAAAPAQAVPFLAERLSPAPTVEEGRVRRLIADLDSDQFAVRQAAVQGLQDLGEMAAPLVRQVLDGKPSLEVRKRLEDLLARGALPPTGEVLRGLRALAVLERSGTAEARQLLEKLARGAPPARLTQEAKASLDRLAR